MTEDIVEIPAEPLAAEDGTLTLPSPSTGEERDMNPQGGSQGPKDANELLLRFVEKGMGGEEQARRVMELLEGAATFVEEVCTRAGALRGAERDEEVKRAMALVGRMEAGDLALYRTRLARTLELTVREFDTILKTLSKAAENVKPEGEPVFTWGGCYGGWLVEYLYDIEEDWAQLAWRDPSGHIGSGNEVMIEGRRYMPWPTNTVLSSGAIQFPSGLGEHKGIRELMAYVELYLRSIYILPSERMYRLISYWVMLTWIYDCFETTIYLRAMGSTGSGKSELMRRIGLVCYRTMTANGAASDSSLFRSLERYKGTVFMDEADIDQSDAESDTVKFYNLGAMRGNPIWRIVEMIGPNNERTFEAVSFQTFCPKLVAMRKEFKDDAVGSRSLTLKLVSREMIELKAAHIPLTINNAIRGQAQALRNLLLRWRLETWQPEIEVDPEFYDLSISARLNQVAGPLLAIAKDDPEQQADIRQTLREYYAETILSQSMTIGARVLEAMWKIHQYPDLRQKCVRMEADGSETMKVGDVAKIANSIIDEMNEDTSGGEGSPPDETKKSKGLSPHRIGGMIRAEMQMRVSERRRDGFWVYWDEARMLGLSMRYGIDPKDFGPVNPSPPAPLRDGEEGNTEQGEGGTYEGAEQPG